MRKKLLCLTPIFPKDREDDTVVPFIYQFLRYFSENMDLEIEVLTLHYPEVAQSYQLDNLKVYAIGGGFKRSLGNFITFLRAFDQVRRLNKHHNYDAVLSFWYGKTALIGLLISRIYGTPHICWLQGQDVKRKNWYLKVFRPKPEDILTVGSNHNQLLFTHHKLNGTIANVAIDPSGFPELKIEDAKTDLMGVGNLGALKNFALFIEVVYELKKTHPGISAVICGDGEERASLQQKIVNLQLSENIKLLGYQKNVRVRDLLNETHILLHTSKFEGNSFAVQEALFSGCKVVSTFPLGVPVENFFFEKDKEALLARIQYLLSNKQGKRKRVVPFQINDTANVVYSALFASTSRKI